jgi:hypothetical protein
MDLLLADTATVASPKANTRLDSFTRVAAVLFAVVALILWFVHFRELKEEPRAVTFLLPPPESSMLSGNSIPAISPDGRRVAFVATTAGRFGLWVRDMDSIAARLLPGTDGANYGARPET